MTFLLIERGGAYFRVADPHWKYPLDGSFSEVKGGRWNERGSFPVVYLCRDIAVARAMVARKFEGLPYGVEDLKPREAPLLVETAVGSVDFVDVVTEEGCLGSELPPTYPKHDDGEEVSWATCQPIGHRAWDEDRRGIACRSAAVGGRGEELAWFQRNEVLHPGEIHLFEEWFWE